MLTVLDPTPSDPAALTLTYTSADGAATYTLDLAALTVGPLHRRRRRRQPDRRDRPPPRRLRPRLPRGRWHALGPNAGRYAGLVLSAEGEPAGHVRGIYGTRRDGSAVVFGKLIGLDGRFRGVLRGTYADGHFDGRWIDRGGDHGAIRGLFRAGDALRAGQFLGRWGEAGCAEQ